MLLRRYALFPILFLLLGGAVFASLTWGAPVAFADIWSQDTAARDIARQIFFELRPPRVVAAILVGGALSVSGAGLQSLFRNPLAEPYLLGISAGGALGATIASALKLPSWNGFDAGALFAFVGALLASATVYA
ncbi:MAG: iron ABC transporter permease, partial [Flavobacteriales bacterium]